MIRAEAFERLNDVRFFHIYSAGDHTRGLFEAEASVVVSATHAREDVQGSFLVFHYYSTPEKPAFCAVINSVLAWGLPSTLTITFNRTNILQRVPNQVA